MIKISKLKDLVGQKIGRWTVLQIADKNKWGKSQWLCRCECGNEKIVSSSSLVNGKSKSCGCYHRDVLINMTTTHGKSNTRLNKIWRGIKQRCLNKKAKAYEKYGKVGIGICKEWEEFVPFMEWSLKNGYTDELTLDKIDNDKNYGPSNCRWVDKKMQARNQRPRNTNKTGVVGVAFRKDQSKYRVTIDDNEGKRINLGQYDTLEEAKEVRKRAELKHWGWTKVI